MVTVRGPAESVESRLAAGALRCPCGGVLAPWGHARRRLVAVPEGWREFWPRRARCRRCGRTHVLLPADLWSRRRYGAAVIVTVLVSAAQAAAAGRAVARPWLAAPGGGRGGAGVDGQVVAGAVRGPGRGAAGAAVRLLPLAEQAARALVPAGSPGGDRLAVLEAVTAGLGRRFPRLAAAMAHEVAAHLSGGCWLAPAVPALGFNTSLLPADAVAPS